MISQKEFYILCNKNSPKNKNRHNGPIDARLFLRDLSLPLAYFLAKRNVAANTVTIWFLAVSVLGNILIAVPSVWFLVIAIFLYEFGQLLDCVDGQLARYYATRSVHGDELDNMSHSIIHGTSMIGIGWRLFATSTNPLFLVLGAIGAFAFAAGSHNHDDHAPAKSATKSVEKKRGLINFSWYKKQVDFLLEEIRVFASLLLLCYLIELYLLPIPLVEMVFVFAIGYTFINNVVLGFMGTVKKAELVEKTAWKGWE